MRKCCCKNNSENGSVLTSLVKETRCAVLGWANVNANGTLADACGNVVVSYNAVGRRILTPPTGATSASISVVEAFSTRDSIDTRLEDFIGQTIHITEGDNGTAANTPRDRAFTIQWYGEREEITDVVSAQNGQLKTVSCNEYAEGFFSNNDIHLELNGANDTISNALMASATVEGSWSNINNHFTYNGTPKVVKASINLKALDGGATSYWSYPQLRVTETVSGRVFWLTGGVVMAENVAYDGSVTMSGGFTHLNPPANASYTLEWFDSENRTATLIPTADSHIGFEAVTEYQTIVI